MLVQHPSCVPSDVVLEEDAFTVAMEMGEQVSDLQATLEGLAHRVRNLHKAIWAQEEESQKVRRENAELKRQLAQGLVLPGNASFAGTGEMPPTPREVAPPAKTQPALCSDDYPQAPLGGNDGRSSPPQLWVDGNLYNLGESRGVTSNSMPLGGQRVSSIMPPAATHHHSQESQSKKAGQIRRGNTSTLSGVSSTNPQRRITKRLTRAGPRQRAVFADSNALKEEVRRAISRPVYDVCDFYSEEGFCQMIARHAAFEFITLAVIFLNAVWIAVDTEMNVVGSSASGNGIIFVVADSLFCSYFLIELLIRFCAFDIKTNVFKDAWFGFDLALVVVMIVETWILPTAFNLWGEDAATMLGESTLLKTVRLVRVTRMARMAKLLRCVPELIIVIKGIGVALRSVMYTWVLMVAVIYVFAIAFRQITYGSALGKKYFDGVFDAMYTLLLRGTLPDLADFMTEVGQESVGLAIILMLFILLVSLTVMNMLIGVLVDVVSVVSKVESYELQVASVKHKLLGMLEASGLDEDGNHRISRQEFGLILVKPEAAKILNDLGVDPVGLVDFTEFIFKGEEELDFPRFMEVILQLRGSNTATVRDVVDMRKWVAEEFRQLHGSLTGQQRPRSRGPPGLVWYGVDAHGGHLRPRVGEQGSISSMKPLSIGVSAAGGFRSERSGSPTPAAGSSQLLSIHNSPSPALGRPAWVSITGGAKPTESGQPRLHSPGHHFDQSADEWVGVDNVKPLVPDGSRSSPLPSSGQARQKGAHSPWKPEMEEDMWDEEV